MNNDMNSKLILIKNINALMDLNEDLDSHAKIARRCAELGAKISARTIGYMLDPDDPKQPKLDSIAAVAKAFNVPPWVLLASNFNPRTRTGGSLPSENALEIGDLIDAQQPTNAEWDLYRKMFAKAAADERIADLRRPQLIQQPTRSKEYERAAKRRR